jgi:peptidoglycan biosynthesis protein MviN/MurJ (putative lipid II flippase)
MLKSSGAMAGATLSSRVLGMVREMVYANFMGNSWEASAFVLAFQVPNLFRRLLGEGALTAAFIPIFKQKEVQEGVTLYMVFLAGFVARGSTVFLTSHVLEIVERLCTHVGIIVKGELVEQAALDTIRRGGSLEDRFLQQAGEDPDATRKLNWLKEAAS